MGCPSKAHPLIEQLTRLGAGLWWSIVLSSRLGYFLLSARLATGKIWVSFLCHSKRDSLVQSDSMVGSDLLPALVVTITHKLLLVHCHFILHICFLTSHHNQISLHKSRHCMLLACRPWNKWPHACGQVMHLTTMVAPVRCIHDFNGFLPAAARCVPDEVSTGSYLLWSWVSS